MSDIDLIAFHRKLLNAPERMNSYQQAIFATVKPGDTVLDVGCGSGILGLFACQAGAAKVYAIEKTSVIELAKQLSVDNGFRDRIVYLYNDVKDIVIDEKVDVIVSELISKGVIGQKMAETIGYCRDNFLKADGRILPAEVDLFVAPVEDAALFKKTVLPDKSCFNLDFSSVSMLSANMPLSAKINFQSLVAVGQSAYHYDAATSPCFDNIDANLRFKASSAATLHGFALWFSSLLADGFTLANTPPGIAAWDNLFLPLGNPVSLVPGMVIDLMLQGRDDSQMPNMWSWKSTVREGEKVISQQSGSSFLASLDVKNKFGELTRVGKLRDRL